jgi:hypothetical protein
VLLGVITALVTGILAVADGARLAMAAMSGGAAFLAAVPLILVIQRELGLFSAPGSD